MPHPNRRWRVAVLAPMLAVVLAACGPTGPTAAPTIDPAATPRPAAEVYAEIRAAVSAIRGLEATAAVDPISISPEQVAANLATEFDAENEPEDLADAEAVLITLGLLPPGTSIREITLDFQSGQVAGYYSPAEDELFVVSRGKPLDASDRVTYAHEFTHQLQDQNIGLDTLGLDARDQSDRSLARLALVEGDAVSAQTTWTRENLSPEEMGELLAVALNPASIDALRRAPPYLRDTALFPYQDGAAFVARLLADGGYEAVDAAYADPPNSTEQVLHPDKYLDREAPKEVPIPNGIPGGLDAGWSAAGTDTLGELLLRIWLREGGATLAEARTATAGWGGDRLVLLRGPDGAVGVALVTEWDSAQDADEFADVARAALSAGSASGNLTQVAGRPATVYLAFGEQAGAIQAALTR